MTPGDIVLKFAEHKNFGAARDVFQRWDERSVIEMHNFVIGEYRHEEELYATRDKYIAMSFLIQLLKEWDDIDSKMTENKEEREQNILLQKSIREN